MSQNEKFSVRLKSFRAKAGLSQAELAHKLGVARNYVSMLENDREPGESLRRLFDMLEREGEAGDHVLREDSATYLAPCTPREKLQHALKKRGLSVAQLSKLTKYSAAVLENVIHGTGRISEKMAKALVKELPELTVEELLDGAETPRVIDETGVRGTHGAEPPVALPGRGTTRYVPLLSWAAAGRLTAADALDEAYDHEGVASSVPGRAFAVEVRGDSMHPEINPGDFAVVRADVPAVPGGVVLVRTIHGDVLCKRYQTRDGGKLVILSSVNRSYEPIEIPASEIAWIYPVKQVIRNY